MLIHKAIRSMKDFGEVYLWLLRYYGFDFIRVVVIRKQPKTAKHRRGAFKPPRTIKIYPLLFNRVREKARENKITCAFKILLTNLFHELRHFQQFLNSGLTPKNFLKFYAKNRNIFEEDARMYAKKKVKRELTQFDEELINPEIVISSYLCPKCKRIHYPLSKVWLKHLPTLDLIKQTISGVLELCEKYNIKKKTDKELLIEEALLNLKLLNGDVNKAIKETEDYILSYFLTDDVTLEDEEGEEINL